MRTQSHDVGLVLKVTRTLTRSPLGVCHSPNVISHLSAW